MIKLNGYRGDGSGMCWPHSPSGVGTVEEPFGPRPFTPHIATVGYDYDFHPGIDIDADAGDPLYSPISGAVCRRHATHFDFENDAQLSELTEVDTQSSATFTRSGSVLAVTCARVGVVSLADSAKYQMGARVHPTANDWTLECEFSAAPSLSSGTIGIGLFNAVNTEYIGLEYDGATFTMRGVGTGAFTANGTTSAVASKTWMRISYTLSTTTYAWQWSADGTTWTNIATEVGDTFTVNQPHLFPSLYWKSGDTNATPFTVNVAQFNLADENLGVGRFGNWLQIAGRGTKVVMGHMRSIGVALGSFVSAGQILGYSGETGFDATSGRIQTEHLHLEYAPTNVYEYTRSDQVNPLKAGLLPRADVSSNVAGVVTSANDPDAVACHLLTITVTRADQDFDVNSITLTGNTTSRTVNFDTRSGLNANVDIPKQSGVYLVPSAFNAASSAYVLAVYFSKAVVGNTFVSFSVLDSTGATVASG